MSSGWIEARASWWFPSEWTAQIRAAKNTRGRTRSGSDSSGPVNQRVRKTRDLGVLIGGASRQVTREPRLEGEADGSKLVAWEMLSVDSGRLTVPAGWRSRCNEGVSRCEPDGKEESGKLGYCSNTWVLLLCSGF